MRQVLADKERDFIQEPTPWGDSWLMPSKLSQHLGCPGCIIEGDWGSGEVRNFWPSAVSQLCSRIASMLSPVCVVSLLHLKFYCWCPKTGHVGSSASGSDMNCWHLSNSWGQGHTLVRQELQLLMSTNTHKETFNTWNFYEFISTTYSIITSWFVYYLFLSLLHFILTIYKMKIITILIAQSCCKE